MGTTTSGPTTSSTSPGAPLIGLRLGFAALGPIEVGMTLEEAQRAAGVPLHDEQLHPDCSEWFPFSESQAVEFVAVDGRLALIDVGAPVVTAEGIGSGATRDDIASAYGAEHMHESTNRFGIREISVSSTDPALTTFRMLFLLDRSGERVERMRSGLAQEMVRDEGCA
jgi:hypothetical protein